MSLKFFLLVSSIVWCQVNKSSSESLLCLQPFPGPELQYDIYACSIVLVWNRYIIQDCLSTTDYEVQYINECTGDILSTNSTNEIFILPKKIPGDCLMNTNCFVRMRLRVNETTWSKYSAWTTLSNNYEATQG